MKKVFILLFAVLLVSVFVSCDAEIIQDKAEHRIYYKSNNGNDITRSNVFYGDKVRVTEPDFRYEGYDFVDWDTLPDGSGESYDPGEEITVSSDITLYAQWETAGSHHIVYYADKEKTKKENVIPDSQEAVIKKPLFSMEGSIFLGWTTNKDGTGDVYFEGDTVYLDSDMELYAQWIGEDVYEVEDGLLTKGPAFDSTLLPSVLILPSEINNETVTGIKGEADSSLGMFHNQEHITHVYFPSTYRTIGEHAFWGTSICELTHLPSSLEYIGDKAFSVCKSLTTLVIPDSCKTLGNYAFQHTSLSDVDLGNGVESIGNYCFSMIPDLKSMVLPGSLKEIGIASFWNTGLIEVVIPPYVDRIPDYAFFECGNLKRVDLSRNVKEIGSFSFQFCESLEEVSFSDVLESIGSYAFSKCTALESVSLPDSLTLLDEGAFWSCSELETIAYEGTNEQWNENVTLNNYCFYEIKTAPYFSITQADGTTTYQYTVTNQE